MRRRRVPFLALSLALVGLLGCQEDPSDGERGPPLGMVAGPISDWPDHQIDAGNGSGPPPLGPGGGADPGPIVTVMGGLGGTAGGGAGGTGGSSVPPNPGAGGSTGTPGLDAGLPSVQDAASASPRDAGASDAAALEDAGTPADAAPDAG